MRIPMGWLYRLKLSLCLHAVYDAASKPAVYDAYRRIVQSLPGTPAGTPDFIGRSVARDPGGGRTGKQMHGIATGLFCRLDAETEEKLGDVYIRTMPTRHPEQFERMTNPGRSLWRLREESRGAPT